MNLTNGVTIKRRHNVTPTIDTTIETGDNVETHVRTSDFSIDQMYKTINSNVKTPKNIYDEIDISQNEEQQLSTDEYIKMLLIDYQLTSGTTNSSMEKLFKVINECCEIKKCPKFLPSTYYQCTKNFKTIPSCRFVCVCGELTEPIQRVAQQKYAPIICDSCKTPIDPIAEIQGERGYFVEMDLENRLRTMIENPIIRKKIRFAKDEDFNQLVVKYGSFKSGQVYQSRMGPNEISLTLFTDGVEIFKSSNKNMWPLFLVINELDPTLKKQFTLPGAVFYGTGKPNGKHLLKCVETTLLKLSNEGLTWVDLSKPEKVNVTKVIKFFIYFVLHLFHFS